MSHCTVYAALQSSEMTQYLNTFSCFTLIAMESRIHSIESLCLDDSCKSAHSTDLLSAEDDISLFCN